MTRGNKVSLRDDGNRTPRVVVAKSAKLRFRFSAHVNQIARVCGLTYEQAAQLMDSV